MAFIFDLLPYQPLSAIGTSLGSNRHLRGLRTLFWHRLVLLIDMKIDSLKRSPNLALEHSNPRALNDQVKNCFCCSLTKGTLIVIDYLKKL